MINYFEKFDYYKNANKQLKELNELCLLFKNMNFLIYLIYGTLLGIVRNNDLIEKDDDIDISYISKKHTFKSVLDEFEYNIRPKLEERGYKIEYIKWSFGKDIKRLCMGQYHLIRNNVCLDLWVSWIDKTKKLWFSPLCEGELTEKDLLPLKRIKFKQYYYYIPNKSKTLLQFLYGVNWKTPAQFKPKVNYFFFQRQIIKIIDEYGWAYDFVAREQQKYSVQDLQIQKIEAYNLDNNPDLIYICSPAMYKNVGSHILPFKAKSKNIVVLGGYSSDTKIKYDFADLIITISPTRRQELQKMYPNNEVIFLPESVDTNFFYPIKQNNKDFIIGYAGRLHKLKRIYLFKKLDFPIKIQSEHKKSDFIKGRSLKPMLDFYHSIDCLIILSKTEAMSRVISEAMACGLPVISTDTGSARMILDTKWIITETSEDDIVITANKLLHLLKSNPKLRKNVGKRNRSFVNKYINSKKNQKYWDRVFSIMVDSHYLMKERLIKVKEIEEEYLQTLEISLEIYEIKKETIIDIIPKHPKVARQKKINKEIIKALIEQNYKVCLMNETCYKAITNKSLDSCELHLGIDNLEKGKILFPRLNLCAFPKNVKSWSIYGLKVFVPFPVVNYLENLYGVNWKNHEL